MSRQIEVCEDRTMLSSLTGFSGDVLPVTLKDEFPGVQNFQFVGVDLTNDDSSSRAALAVQTNSASGDLALTYQGVSAGFVVLSDRADVLTNEFVSFETLGEFYFAPGTDDGIAGFDQDPSDPGFQGRVEFWVSAGDPLFSVADGAPGASLIDDLQANRLPQRVSSELLSRGLPLSESYAVTSREIRRSDDTVQSQAWLVINEPITASDTDAEVDGYVIQSADDTVVVFEAHAVDVQVVGGVFGYRDRGCVG